MYFQKYMIKEGSQKDVSRVKDIYSRAALVCELISSVEMQL